MTPSPSAFNLNPEFDNFLFTKIGEDKNGMWLSVASALARLNVDPWQEAAALADLPKDTATRRLASLIAKLPVEQAGKLDENSLANRLIALLPRRQEPVPAPREGGAVVGVMTDPRIAMIVFFAISMLVALFMAANQRPTRRANYVPAPASGAVLAPPLAPVPPATTTDARSNAKMIH